MLNAKSAAAISASNQVKVTNQPELDIIDQRIQGAANAGLTKVEVILASNVIDSEAAELIKQNLLDQGYKVELGTKKYFTEWKFKISW